MATPYIGEIRLFAGNYAPSGFAVCNGNLLAISQNQVLFALLGTTYGGNGTTTFALPDLRGRVPVSQGQGLGLSNYACGQAYGAETETLTTEEMPLHLHPFNANSGPAQYLSPTPSNTTTVATAPPGNYCYSVANQFQSMVQLNPSDVVAGGGGQSHPNIMPVLAINYIIAIEGIYPSQS